MSRYRFEQIAINSTEKRKPTESDMATYIGLEHMDSHSLIVKRWGSDVPIIGDKLVMKKGDVLLGKRNAYLRRAAIAPFDGLFSAHGMVLRPKTDVIDKDFFPIFIASDYFFDEAIRISVGSLSPTINWKDLKDVEFNLPALDEQRKLAKILWAIIKTTNSYQDMLEKQDLLIKSQFIEMFGTINLSEQKGSWTELGEVTQIVTGTTPSTLDESNWGGNINWITPAELDENTFFVYDSVRKITEKGRKSKALTLMPVGTVLLSTRAPIGKVAILGKEMTCNQGFKNFVCSNKILPVYLYVLLRNNNQYLNSLGTGTTFLELSKSIIEKIKIPLPSINHQDKFIKFVDQIDKSKFMHNIVTKGETYAYI